MSCTEILDIDNIVNEMYPIATTGLVGGGFIGYGKNLFDNYYLGIEALCNASNARGNYFYNLIPIADTNDRNLVSQSVAIKSTWGIDVVPGYKIANIALLYGRVGIKWASLSSTSEFYIVKDNVPSATSTPHRSVIKPGFNFGFGIELAVANQLSVRGELTHTTYQSYNATAANKNFSYKFYDNQAMAALIYHFV